MSQKCIGTMDLAHWGLPIILAINLVACGGPADKRLVTDGTKEQYEASLEKVADGLTTHEKEAFTWAVTGFDLPKFNAMYPNGSVRQVIRSQVSRARESYPQQLADLQRELEAQRPVLAELVKVRATAKDLRIESSFFGPKPVIEATLINESSLPLGRLNWRANLYLGESNESVATTVLKSDFRSIGGLDPGRQVAATFNVGFVTGDESWTTLDVRNAQRRRVVLEALPEGAMDYGDKPYIASNHQRELELLEQRMKQAESFSDI